MQAEVDGEDPGPIEQPRQLEFSERRLADGATTPGLGVGKNDGGCGFASSGSNALCNSAEAFGCSLAPVAPPATQDAFRIQNLIRTG